MSPHRLRKDEALPPCVPVLSLCGASLTLRSSDCPAPCSRTWRLCADRFQLSIYSDKAVVVQKLDDEARKL